MSRSYFSWNHHLIAAPCFWVIIRRAPITPSVLVPSEEILSQTAAALLVMVFGISALARVTSSTIWGSDLGSAPTLVVSSMYSLGAIFGGSSAGFAPSGLEPAGS